VVVRGGQGSGVDGLAFSSDGETLASVSSDNTVRLWDAPERVARARIHPNVGELRSVAFAPDGKTFAVGTRYGLIKVWESTGREELATLRGHSADVCAVAVSP